MFNFKKIMKKSIFVLFLTGMLCSTPCMSQTVINHFSISIVQGLAGPTDTEANPFNPHRGSMQYGVEGTYLEEDGMLHLEFGQETSVFAVKIFKDGVLFVNDENLSITGGSLDYYLDGTGLYQIEVYADGDNLYQGELSI